MCRTLAVSTAGFYAWMHRTPSRHSIEDSRILRVIREEFAKAAGPTERLESRQLFVGAAFTAAESESLD